MTPCPHCGALARLERSASLRWRCGVCGGPVVAIGAIARDHGELPALVRAQRARAISLGWNAAALVLAAMAVMATGLGLLLWGAAHGAALVLVALAAGSSLLALVGRRRAGRRGAEVRAELEQAWRHVADEVLRARGGELTATDLAATMQTDQAHAEALLSSLSAGGRARVEVRDDAELAYRVDASGSLEDEAQAPTGAGQQRAR